MITKRILQKQDRKSTEICMRFDSNTGQFQVKNKNAFEPISRACAAVLWTNYINQYANQYVNQQRSAGL